MAIRNSETTRLVTFGTPSMNVEAAVTEVRAGGADPTTFHRIRGTVRFLGVSRGPVEFSIIEFQGDLEATGLEDRAAGLIFEAALGIIELQSSLEYDPEVEAMDRAMGGLDP